MKKVITERVKTRVLQMLHAAYYNSYTNTVDIPYYNGEGYEFGRHQSDPGDFQRAVNSQTGLPCVKHAEEQDVIDAINITAQDPDILKEVWKQIAPGWEFDIRYNPVDDRNSVRRLTLWLAYDWRIANQKQETIDWETYKKEHLTRKEEAYSALLSELEKDAVGEAI